MGPARLLCFRFLWRRKYVGAYVRAPLGRSDVGRGSARQTRATCRPVSALVGSELTDGRGAISSGSEPNTLYPIQVSGTAIIDWYGGRPAHLHGRLGNKSSERRPLMAQDDRKTPVETHSP